MKNMKTSKTIFTEPFQLRFPKNHSMIGSNEEGFATFVGELRGGMLGIEAELSIFSVEKNDGDGDWGYESGPSWWSGLGSIWIPGPQEGNIKYQLFYLPNTFLELSYQLILDFDLSVLEYEVYDDDHPLCSGFSMYDSEPTEAAKEAFVALLRHHLEYRPITDPEVQIPNYASDCEAELFRYSRG
jgi:hypothetical protein